MIATCLAYIWIIHWDGLAWREEWRKLIHRITRCDLSLFQLGLRVLEYFLNEDKEIPVAFQKKETSFTVVSTRRTTPNLSYIFNATRPRVCLMRVPK